MESDYNQNDTLENEFVDYFGMTIDQIERLDYDVQEEIIKKVIKIRKKIGNKKNIKFKEIIKHYPIFKKTLSKRKSLFK